MVAEFIAEEGALKGLVLRLEGGPEWKVGRDPESCDLLVEDPKVSRLHLIVRATEDGYLIENMSSTNPARINDSALIGPHLLQEGDKVRIGSTDFHFYKSGNEQVSSFQNEPLALEDDLAEDSIYQDDPEGTPEVQFDLSETSRFILKVIAGPNTGAEFALDPGKEYLIGTDTATCDIVFHDLSVSREHARLFVGSEGSLSIVDLGSRNGILIERMRIEGKKAFTPNMVVTVGTSAFIVIDRHAPTETIMTPFYEPAESEKASEVVETEEEIEESTLDEPVPEPIVKKAYKPPLSAGALLLTVLIGGMVVLLGIGLVSLFKEQPVTVTPRDYNQELADALKPFPAVKSTYNKATGKLFLVGHVATGVEKNELFYRLQGLNFVRGIDDNIIIDDAIWQEMNLSLAAQPEFEGVTMHSPTPGSFVLSGYLKTNRQAALLTDYMNRNFNFLSLLHNEVVVEEQVMEEVTSKLIAAGFNGVTPTFSGGELILTGYINALKTAEYQLIVGSVATIPGIRSVRNYVVPLSPEQAVVDLNELYPGRYQVTGYSRHGNVNVNVLINGKILTRGDSLENMTITSIQPHTIFLEKDGLKYKIEYNK